MVHSAWGPRSKDSSVESDPQQSVSPLPVNTSFGSIRRPSMAKLQMIDENDAHVQTIVFNNDEDDVAMEQPTLLVKITVCILATIAIVICLGMLFIKID